MGCQCPDTSRITAHRERVHAVSDQLQGAGWWQATDGKWSPQEQASQGKWSPPEQAAQTQVPDAPRGAPPEDESVVTDQRRASAVDAAGATLVVVGIVGVVAWVWGLVRTQFVVAQFGSLGARLDMLAQQIPVLLLAGAVAGLGIGLRALAGTQPGSPARPVFGRPVGPMLLAGAAALVVFVGSAAIFGDHDDGISDLGAQFDDPPSVDDVVVIGAPTLTTPDGPPESAYTLEVHSDGCGVFRSGAIGDDLTWVIKDEDGFQVLGRNAAGETQYRYFRPGTYTVALESWDVGYYVTVSNEVTITC